MSAQSAYSLALRQPAFVLTLPPMLYVAGGYIMGEIEVDSQLAYDDNIEKIYVQLQGTMQTRNRKGEEAVLFEVETSDFLRRQATLWVRHRSPLPFDGDTLRLPFELKLPDDAPPSFAFETFMNNAYVRYAIEVVGTRMGTFAVDRKIVAPIVVLQRDPIGNSIRAQMKIGWGEDWGRLKVENDMRKLPWGEYAHAKLELLVPHIDTFPLFTNIPYTIIITTLSPPMKRKSNTQPEKDLFPFAPRSPSELDFELRRFVDMKTPYEPSNPEEHVSDIISKAHAPIPPVEVELGDYVWLPEPGRDGRGRWMQEVSYHSAMYLRCTPTFHTEEIKIKYTLCLRVEFPGLGNILRLELPINVGSGVEASLPAEMKPNSPRMVDLPTSYWKPSTWSDE